MGKSRKTEIDIDEISPIEEEEEEEKEEEGEEGEEPEQEEPSEKFQLTRKRIILIAIASFVILAIIIGTILYFSISTEPPTPTPTPPPPIAKVPDNYPFGTFFLPLKSSNPKKEEHFLKLTIELKVKDPKIITEIKDNIVSLNKNIYNIIKKKSKGALDTTKEQKKLNKEILDNLNSSLKSGKIKEIYFSEFFIM